MDFTDSQSGWIWAVKNGGALSSNSVSENINQHDGQGDFTFDLTKARGGDSLNPFVQAAATGTASGGASPTSASSSNGSGASGDESPSEESSGGESYGGGSSIGSSSGGGSAEREKRDHAVIAHGTTMGLAFALFFPIGAIIIRLFNFRGLVWVHVATQVFAYTIAVVGLGLGIYIAVTPSQYQLVSLTTRSFLTWDFPPPPAKLTSIVRTDRDLPPHHRHPRRRAPSPPTHPRPHPPLHLQTSRRAHHLGHRSRLVRSRRHHPGDHQRRVGPKT